MVASGVLMVLSKDDEQGALLKGKAFDRFETSSSAPARCPAEEQEAPRAWNGFNCVALFAVIDESFCHLLCFREQLFNKLAE